jgi:PilZ domain
MERKRRSGRIVCELDIVLLGTDTAGKVIMEQTKTVVLSRHGAGIVSRYRFSPDELLTLSLPHAAREAEIRLVGQIGGEPGRYIYGVAFVDPDPHFWPMDFPEPEAVEADTSQMLLECSRCQARETIQQHEIEDDVYTVNGYILRPCAACGTATPWKKAEGKPLPAPAAGPPKPARTRPEFTASAAPASNGTPARTGFTGVQVSPPASATRAVPDAPVVSLAESFESGLCFSPMTGSPARSSSYSGASTTSEFTSLTESQPIEAQTSRAAASATAVLQASEAAAPSASRTGPSANTLANALPRAESTRELDATGRPVNKRRHVRIRVSFAACVRHPAHADEVVECENVSKGGACFHSLQHYDLDSMIEVAAPFSPGETALFVPARIKRIEPLSGGLVFRYGVEYIKP